MSTIAATRTMILGTMGVSRLRAGHGRRGGAPAHDAPVRLCVDSSACFGPVAHAIHAAQALSRREPGYFVGIARAHGGDCVIGLLVTAGAHPHRLHAAGPGWRITNGAVSPAFVGFVNDGATVTFASNRRHGA